MEWTETLGAAANLVVLVGLPSLFLLFRHLSHMRADIEARIVAVKKELRTEVSNLSEMVIGLERELRAHERTAAREFLTREEMRQSREDQLRAITEAVSSAVKAAGLGS